MDFPLVDNSRWGVVGTGATSSGTALTAGSANTKGAYAELSSAIPFAASGFVLCVSNPSAAADYLLDISVGTANSEREIIPNFYFDGARASQGTAHAYFPIPIREGARLAARCQCATGSATIEVHALLVESGMAPSAPAGRCTAYGATTASSTGTTITASGSPNTKGSWSQLVAATVYPISWVVVCIGAGAANVTARHRLDIGYGPANSERAVIEDLGISSNTTSDECEPKALGAVPCSIPLGSRIAARMQSTTGSSAVAILLLGMD